MERTANLARGASPIESCASRNAFRFTVDSWREAGRRICRFARGIWRTIFLRCDAACCHRPLHFRDRRLDDGEGLRL